MEGNKVVSSLLLWIRYFTFLFLIWPTVLFALPPIVLNDQISSFEIAQKDVEIFEDSTRQIPFQKINELPESSFIQNPPLVTFHPHSTYWIKFVVKSDCEKKKKWILEVLDSRHYELDLYVPNAKGEYEILHSGIKQYFKTRNYQHKNFVMDLDLLQGSTDTLYLKVNSYVVGSVLFKIRANDEFSSYAFNEYYFLGIYYGILAIICIFNLILFISLREKLYLIYSFYIIAWSLNSMFDDGIGYQYLWPNTPVISQLGFVISKPLLVLLFVWYSLLFLNFENPSLLKYKKWVFYSVSFYLTIFLIHQFVPIPFAVYFLTFLVPFMVIVFISIKVHSLGFKPARFFIFGNTFIILGFILRMAKDQGIIEPPIAISIFLNYSQNAGIVMEIGTLFLALGDRFRFLKIQKEEAQGKMIEQLKENELLSQKVNRELEHKVSERTQELVAKQEELKELNEKLEKQAEEINKWNQLLDLDNHKLKRKVKEVIEARIKSEEVPYEEFLQIFPDELSCQRYIDEIKWREGYTCKKCNNSKFCKGTKIFSRRCTKCGYNESVTAFTFLHKCKFSLVKAFYIMMKVNKYGEEVNCAELARELDMRKSTVWEFKSKIMECKSSKQKDLDFLILNNLR
jgi:hypothetical protein